MRKAVLYLILSLVINFNSFSQNDDIIELINQSNIDSLLNSVSELSGEKACIIDGKEVLLNRKNQSNHLSAIYLMNKLKAYGYEAEIQFCPNSITEIENVIATLQGNLYPEKRIVFCAHYDSDSGMNAPGADDNASGTAIVLEAARLMRDFNPNYSIVFALWDAEEWGLLGSECYSKKAKFNSEDIIAVINMDMLAYNVSDEYSTIVHLRSDEMSLHIWETVKSINKSYGLNHRLDSLNNTQYFGTDIVSFWRSGYSGISFAEKDLNPGYHTAGDRMNIFNNNYYFSNSKLSIATLAYLSKFMIISDVEDISQVDKLLIMPNPAYEYIEINLDRWTPPGRWSPSDIQIFNTLGECVNHFTPHPSTDSGSENSRIDISHLPRGVYYIRIGSRTQMFVKV